MEFRRLGDSSVKASAITFGAWAIGGWMWGGAERKDALEAIRASINEGVTSIDTAPVYGQGLSEEIVGEALSGIPRDTTTPIDETMEAVSLLLKQGKIRAAGVSNYNVQQMEAAEKVVPLASNQVPYSMVERTIEVHVVPHAIENNISIIAYSPLQRGLLTGKIKPGHQFAAGDHRPGTKFYKEENIKKINQFLEQIKPIAEGKNASLSQLVLRWTIEQPGITIALAGARNAEQAVQNARAINVKLSAEEMETINELLSRTELVG